MIPKKPVPDLIRDGYRFSQKIMREHILAALDSSARSREHLTVLVPRVAPGTKEGTRTLRVCSYPWLPPQL
jgi:hypothetical protein